MQKLRLDFGWKILSPEAVSRRLPISFSRMVARTEGYTYDAKVWDSSVVHGPFSVAPCQTLTVRFAQLFHRCNPPLLARLGTFTLKCGCTRCGFGAGNAPHIPLPDARSSNAASPYTLQVRDLTHR
jgi:hypothetical protein